MYKKGNTRNSKRLNKKKLQETGHRNNINAVNIALPCDNKVEDSNLQTLEISPLPRKKIHTSIKVEIGNDHSSAAAGVNETLNNSERLSGEAMEHYNPTNKGIILFGKLLTGTLCIVLPLKFLWVWSKSGWEFGDIQRNFGALFAPCYLLYVNGSVVLVIWNVLSIFLCTVRSLFTNFRRVEA